MKKICLLSLSACLLLAANNANIDDSKAKIKEQELLIHNLFVEQEELLNQNLKLAQWLHDLEEALNENKNCCGAKTKLATKQLSEQEIANEANKNEMLDSLQNEDTKDETIQKIKLLQKRLALKEAMKNKEKELTAQKNSKENEVKKSSKNAMKNSANSNTNPNKPNAKKAAQNSSNDELIKRLQEENKKLKEQQSSLDEMFLMLNKNNIEQTVSVKSEKLNLRALPSTKSKIIKTFNKDDVLNYKGVASNQGSLWLKVENGYVYAKLTSFKELVQKSKKQLLGVKQ